MTRSRPGFTLIELMLTVMLLSVGILAVIATVTGMSRYQNLNVTAAELAGVSYSKLDELRARTLTTLGEDPMILPGGSSTGCDTGSDSTNYRIRARGPSGQLYCLAWQVTETNMPPSTRLLRLRGSLVGIVRGPTQDIATLLYVPPAQ